MRSVVLAVLVLAACDDESRWVVEPGIVDFYGGRLIEFPLSVAVGQTFLLRVTTYGGGCIEIEGDDLEANEDGAVYTPLDRRYVPRENEGCTLILKQFPHSVSVRFDTPGAKAIRVRGRRVGSDAGVRVDETIDIPYTVVVE